MTYTDVTIQVQIPLPGVYACSPNEPDEEEVSSSEEAEASDEYANQANPLLQKMDQDLHDIRERN